jgi:hypothetical protein
MNCAPHLARSVLISARLQLERARVASEALAALGVPALVFNETERVLAANPLIEALTGFVRWRAFDRVSLKDKGADELLRDAVATIDSESKPEARSFPARDAEAEQRDGHAKIILAAEQPDQRERANILKHLVDRGRAPLRFGLTSG